MGSLALCLLASLLSSFRPLTNAQICNYTSDNHCNNKLVRYECNPPATTCCYHLEFTDSACECRKELVGALTRSDKYIHGSCRIERSLVQDPTQCPQLPPPEYYMQMIVSGEGSTLKYCYESFSDSNCISSNNDKACFSKDPLLGSSTRKIDGVDQTPLNTCMPEDSFFVKVVCGSCTPPPYDPANPSACSNPTAHTTPSSPTRTNTPTSTIANTSPSTSTTIQSQPSNPLAPTSASSASSASADWFLSLLIFAVVLHVWQVGGLAATASMHS